MRKSDVTPQGRCLEWPQIPSGQKVARATRAPALALTLGDCLIWDLPGARGHGVRGWGGDTVSARSPAVGPRRSPLLDLWSRAEAGGRDCLGRVGSGRVGGRLHLSVTDGHGTQSTGFYRCCRVAPRRG